MSTSVPQPRAEVSEQDARKVAEAARESEWKSPSFMKELFLMARAMSKNPNRISSNIKI